MTTPQHSPTHDATLDPAVQQHGSGSGDGRVEHRPSVRRSTETKASFKTTELIVYVAAVVGVLVASYLVKDTVDGRADYFLADKAWFYIVLLSIGYMISRGVAKSGSRDHDDAAQH